MLWHRELTPTKSAQSPLDASNISVDSVITADDGSFYVSGWAQGDLVIDASGRNSKTPEWLDSLGFEVPEETNVNAHIGYATRIYEKPAGHFDWKILFINGNPKGNIKRGGAIFEISDTEWMVTMGGVNQDYPPTEEAAFLDYARGKGAIQQFLRHLEELAAAHAKANADPNQPQVTLTTMFRAKGLEWPFVFVPNCNNGTIPYERRTSLEEERRLAYVGITRARQKLVMTYAESRRIHGMDMYGMPSRFLREIPGHLLNEVRPRVQVARPMAAPPRVAHPVLETPSLKLGQGVVHASFGRGVVTDYEGSGAHARVQVNFDDAGSKWLVLAFANLQPL